MKFPTLYAVILICFGFLQIASGQEATSAQLISKPKVKLPKEAKESGSGGPVRVLLSLDMAGNVLSVENVVGPGSSLQAG